MESFHKKIWPPPPFGGPMCWQYSTLFSNRFLASFYRPQRREMRKTLEIKRKIVWYCKKCHGKKKRCVTKIISTPVEMGWHFCELNLFSDGKFICWNMIKFYWWCYVSWLHFDWNWKTLKPTTTTTPSPPHFHFYTTVLVNHSSWLFPNQSKRVTPQKLFFMYLVQTTP